MTSKKSRPIIFWSMKHLFGDKSRDCFYRIVVRKSYPYLVKFNIRFVVANITFFSIFKNGSKIMQEVASPRLFYKEIDKGILQGNR